MGSVGTNGTSTTGVPPGAQRQRARPVMNRLNALLVMQHQHLRRLMVDVIDAGPSTRRAAFDRFRQYLAVHEATEQEMIHAPADGLLDRDRGIAQARLREEEAIARRIRSLEAVDLLSSEFTRLFDHLRTAVLEHLEAEETQELPEVERLHDDERIASATCALERVTLLARSPIGPACYEDWVDRALEQLIRWRDGVSEAASAGHHPGG